MQENRKSVRFILTDKRYLELGWPIPMVQLNDHSFKTGQELSHDKMLGKVELTEKEREKYPYVINPNVYLKAIHGKDYFLDIPEDVAKLKLIKMSTMVASSHSKYLENPTAYIGYLKDDEADAVDYVDKVDKELEAKFLIKELNINDFKKVAGMINFRTPSSINLNSTINVLRSGLFKACEIYPDDVMMCFEKYNPGISHDAYILELVNHGILRKEITGEIFDGQAYIAKGLSGVKEFLSKDRNEHYADKWKKKLDNVKGITTEKVIPDVSAELKSKYELKLNEIKIALFEENIGLSEMLIKELETNFTDVLSKKEYENILSKLNELKTQGVDHNIEKEKFIESLKELELDKLHGKINHHASKYSKDHCNDFWEDKEKIIEYMVSVKFPE